MNLKDTLENWLVILTLVLYSPDVEQASFYHISKPYVNKVTSLWEKKNLSLKFCHSYELKVHQWINTYFKKSCYLTGIQHNALPPLFLFLVVSWNGGKNEWNICWKKCIAYNSEKFIMLVLMQENFLMYIPYLAGMNVDE